MRAPLLDDDEEDEVKLLDSFRHTATEFNVLIVADMMTTPTREKDTTFIYILV
jgi:hypothetical protein